MRTLQLRLILLCILLLAAFCLHAAEPSLKISEADAKKAAIQKPAPAYPMVARQLKVSGKVTLEAVIGEDGTVTDVHIVTGNPLLTKPAVEAVRKWQFHPFELDGKPAPAIATLTFEFDTH